MCRTIDRQCSVCNNKESKYLFSAGDFDNLGYQYHLYGCHKCGLVFLAPLPASKELENFYEPSYYGSNNNKFLSAIEVFIKAANKYKAHRIDSFSAALLNVQCKKKGCILDIGCGRAYLLSEFCNLGYKCYGLERENFSGQYDTRIEMIKKNSTIDTGLINKQIDIVILWHVLEHLLEPNQVLREIYRILSDNGVLIISVPNIRSYQARIFRSHWFHLDLPRHVYHYSMKSILYLLKDSNFKIIQKHSFSFEHSVFGFIQSTFNKFFPSSKNRYYSLLKEHSKSLSDYLKILIWSILALFCFPFALLELILSTLTGNGAVITVFAIKSHLSHDL